MTKRRIGLFLVLLATAAAALPFAGVPEVPGRGVAHAAEPERPQAGQRVRVTVSAITPKAVRPDSTIVITGRVANTSAQQLRRVSLRLRYSASRLNSRTQMERHAGGKSPGYGPVARSTEVAATLAPGASARWRLEVPARSLGLRAFGVYPLTLEVVDARGVRMDAQRTFLPYVPDAPEQLRPKPTQVAWLWPLVDRPHRAGDDTFIDGKLEKSLAQRGRLGTLVSAAASAPDVNGGRFPLTWMIDPMLLEDASLMAKGYEVADGSESSPEPSGTAKAWLGRVRSATESSSVVAVPYADPDMVALTHAGLDKNVINSVTTAPSVASSILDRPVKNGLVWPPRGQLDQDTLDNLAVAGTQRVVLSDTALPPAQRLTYTPDAAATIPTSLGPMKALIADSTISRVLGRAGNPSQAALIEQRFLAETAMITAERPNRERTLLVAPPRRWNPSHKLASALLADSSKVPWLQPVPLDTMAQASEPIKRMPLTYPPSRRATELSPQYLAEVKEIKQAADRFSGILSPRSPLLDLAILRTESSAWRYKPELGVRVRERVRATLDDKRKKVKVLNSDTLSLASTTGTVPITIANELAERTVTVRLRVTAHNKARLDIGKHQHKVTLGPQRKETIEVPMRAVARGVATVNVQLYTPRGEPLEDHGVRMKVRATGYGASALAITGGAFGVLCLAVAIRLVRRTLRRDREHGSGSGEGEGAADHAADTDSTAHSSDAIGTTVNTDISGDARHGAAGETEEDGDHSGA